EISQNVSCPKDWINYDHHCYWLGVDLRSWQEAQDDCQRKDSNLVTIDTEEENYLVKGMQCLQDNAWIGAYATDHTPREWRWVADNSTVIFFDWGPNEPFNLNGVEDCVHFLNSQWNDGLCSVKKPFICEQEG
ncbi:asialoglycoprotein receptor 1-like, partial [Ylistrum balloti]|uniref:asialoglycoprotein receptor 1-like n=1 Tax=Ylistrum balloti TaxID=509963 RepID=UPI002905B1BD